MRREKSLPGKVRVSQREVLLQKKVLLVLYGFVLVLIQVVVPAVLMARGRQEYTQECLVGYFSENLSLQVVAMVYGVSAAFQSFSWLHSRRELDFYESQPITRRARFWSIVWNDIWTFLAGYLISIPLGLLVVTLYGRMSGGILRATLQAIPATCAIFLSSFGLATLAVMVTGKLILSSCALLVFFFYVPAVRAAGRTFLDVLSQTRMSYYTLGEDIIVPYLTGIPTDVLLGMFAGVSTRLWTRQILACVLIGGISLALGYLAYTRRRSEMAGQAVLFGWVRHLVKAALVILVAEVAALLAAGSESIGTAVVLPSLMILLFGFATCVALECIYHGDLRGWRAGGIENLVLLGLSLALFFGARQGVAAYDRWIPEESEVKSTAVFPLQYGGLADYYRQTMVLPASETKRALALARDGVSHLQDNTGAEQLCVLYRLKNGSTRVRQYQVCEEAIEKYMDPISRTQAFQKSYFPFGEETILNHAVECSFDYNSYASVSESKAGLAAAKSLQKAYQKDLEKWVYSDTLVGEFGQIELLVTYQGMQESTSFACPVYPSFTHTISYLKKNELYIAPVTK